jgi:hypothetical protein
MDDIIMDKVSKALEPINSYVDALYGVREEICIVKEFLQSRYEKEKNPETKVVLSLAIRRLREQIDNIDRIRGNLLPDMQVATMNFASVLIKDAISEICEIENKKNV